MRRSACFGVNPIITPLRTTFSRALMLGIEADSELDEGSQTLPAMRISPVIGLVDAREDLEEGALS